MAEIVNLKRVRKTKARSAKAKTAEANRIKHGTAKAVRDLAKARAEKDASDIDQHRLDSDTPNRPKQK